MNNERSALANWTAEEIALGKRWVKTWELAAVNLERIHRAYIRELDSYRAIALRASRLYEPAPRAEAHFRTGRTTAMVHEGGPQ